MRRRLQHTDSKIPLLEFGTSKRFPIPTRPFPVTTSSCPVPTTPFPTIAGLQNQASRSETSLSLLLESRTSSETKCEERPTRKSNNAFLVEGLARLLIGHIVDHDFTHLDFLKYLHDDYAAYLEYRSDEPYLKGREVYLAGYQAFVKAHPGYTLEIESLHGDVDEKNGTAVVWMNLIVEGHSKGVRRQSITMQQWRRKDGGWRAYKQTGIRGVDETM
ncbi:hypothetical protein LTR09_005370 [Extremus antarcticus]|uniref:Uncharacterized protein n=1 Tax=Extremus antarcticus TaxID=702011 RepID=A0AAJ0DNK6_9PEZI|nr:hypothetical protein LTR09_005370 [Extremus antarcticus]